MFSSKFRKKKLISRERRQSKIMLFVSSTRLTISRPNSISNCGTNIDSPINDMIFSAKPLQVPGINRERAPNRRVSVELREGLSVGKNRHGRIQRRDRQDSEEHFREYEQGGSLFYSDLGRTIVRRSCDRPPVDLLNQISLSSTCDQSKFLPV